MHTQLTTTLILITLSTSAAACQQQEARADQPAAPPAAETAQAAKSEAALKQELLDRGKYLVNAVGCGDCHTPMKMGANGPERDMTRRLSGHPENLRMPPAPKASGPWIAGASATMTAWSGPWGMSFTANITPDKETGIGSWTEENFVRTIRTGRHLGNGRPLLPPMPIPFYRNFSDDDLKAIYWYLQSLPPVKNRVPAPQPPV